MAVVADGAQDSTDTGYDENDEDHDDDEHGEVWSDEEEDGSDKA